MTDTETTAAPGPYDWSTDPDAPELLLDPTRAALDALASAVVEVIENLAPIEGTPDDGCTTCIAVRTLRDALRGVELTLGSES